MKRTPKIILRVIGVIAVLCAGFGLYYNAATLKVSFSGAFTAGEPQDHSPYFSPAFYIMSAVCIACYAMLTIFGVQFIRGRAAHSWPFTALLIFEVVYFFCIGVLWSAPGLGMSVAAATGVANGGLMAQFLILFPLWAPPLAFWARSHLNDSTNVA
jgi:hypothetical protein